MFEELRNACRSEGIGGFLPAVRQVGNVAALPAIVSVRVYYFKVLSIVEVYCFFFLIEPQDICCSFEFNSNSISIRRILKKFFLLRYFRHPLAFQTFILVTASLLETLLHSMFQILTLSFLQVSSF